MFVAALKKGNPDITPKQAMQIWDETNSKTDLSLLTPDQGAKIAYKLAEHSCKSTQKLADGGMPEGIDPNILSGANANVLANQANVLAGEKYQDPNRINELLRNAYSEYQNRINAMEPERSASKFIAATGGAEPLKASKESWEDLDKKALGLTVGKESEIFSKLLEAQKQGVITNKSLSDTLESLGKASEEIKQKKQQTEIGQLGVESARRMNDPNSMETQLAKIMLIDQFKQAGIPAPKGIETASAQQLTGFMDKNVLDAYTKKLGIVTKEAEAAKDQAIAQELTGTTKPSMPGVAPRTAMPSLTPEGQDRLKYATISGAGVTLPPNPVDVAKAQGEGQQAVDFNKQVRVYKTEVEPIIDETLAKLKTTAAGKGTDLIAKWMPGNDQQELVNMLAQVNNTYPGALPPEIAGNIVAAQKAGGFTGSPLQSMTNDQIARSLDRIKLGVANNIRYQQESEKRQPGNYGKTQQVSPGPNAPRAAAGTIEMTKNGKTYDIPADKAAAAEAAGYKRK